MTHAELADIARRWLLRTESRGGPGCSVAFTEVGALWETERADAWGCRWGFQAASVVVEVKVSRADFLRDRLKPHRAEGGMGDFRYFLCPEEVITIDDLPDRWGLLWVNKRGRVRTLAGHIACNIPVPSLCGEKEVLRKSEAYIAELWRHECNRVNERSMLAHIISRVAEPEVLLKKLRKAEAEKHRLAALVDTIRPQLNAAGTELARLRNLLDRHGIGDTSCPAAAVPRWPVSGRPVPRRKND